MSTCPFFVSDFSKWVAVRLLRVAAAPDCDIIHGRVSAVLCSLLHTLRVRAPFIFSLLAKELIRLAQDLSSILSTHVATLAGQAHALDKRSRWPVRLESFSTSPGCVSSYLTPSPLVLSSPAALESLTAVTVGVVTDALRGVLSLRDLSVAWETACCILANGNTRLRKISMVMLRRQVELGGFPVTQSHEFFTAYLQLLETQPVNTSTGSDETQPYDGELLQLTSCVFRSPGACHTHFEPIYLSQMFECVCTLAGGGVKLGSEVTESLCFLFSFLLSVAPVYETATLLRRQRVTQVCRTLACTVGTESQAEVRLFLFVFKSSLSPSRSLTVNCVACVLQCAEGFLRAALKAEAAVLMQEAGDGKPAAKKSCKSASSKTSKTPSV